ncbi:methyl-accepting chemotaxis protein [Vibrio neptunius]|uniref:Methyl-accepting chemotaxis protein n=1 Tax=Vibrio neptunius TaxID=170651 RepID=A0ABS3A497_9VIBR|nr:methyl-accepting chemotaxis protein [Vibrio neptunius]MBN3493793.1 methyl-accepting chemotaxis protein [Vibrio neptunius]MBN3516289.1 methyl-accepting chemotaxis protein [Vibrio neptunius]MBN3550234.1 methyl-accepting chemotaxis protein [Vibrio neptunius]MBN3578502.1 methyl-accepting chemotaxis protein [Vibrio neptunius]MCH9872167.1 methyl-accepting chemotaxis protein [Vibrio neptunius]
MTLYQRILLFSCLSLLVGVATITFVSTNRMNEQLHLFMNQSLLSQSTITAKSITDWIDSKQKIVSSVAELLSNQVLSDEQIVSAMKMVKSSGGFSVAYFGSEQGDMFRNLGKNTVENYDPRIRPWYKEAKLKRELVTIGPYVGKADGKLVIFIASPIVHHGNKIHGVAGVNLPLEKITHDVVSAEMQGNGFAFLVTKDGKIIAHPKTELAGLTLDNFTNNITINEIASAAKSEDILEKSFDSQNFLVSSVPVKGTDWFLVLAGDEELIEGQVNRLVAFQLSISVVLVLLMILLTSALLRYSIRNLLDVSQALDDIAEGDGDLTVKINISQKDEVGRLSEGFNKFVSKVHKIISTVNRITHRLNESSQKTAANANEQTNHISKQQSEISMVATAVTQMAVATDEIARNAETTAEMAQGTVSSSLAGRDFSHRSNESMKGLAAQVENTSTIIGDLEEQSNQINKIVSSISDIAEQTNLLALNAAIEAARAGEQGRGFAVVADQVRELSHSTHKSTEEASSMINELQTTTRKAVNAMSDCHMLANQSLLDNDNATTSFDQICTQVHGISDMATQISTAAEQQSSVTSEIAKNTEEIRVVSETLLTESQQALSQAQELKENASALEFEVRKFRL